ncbi:MAG: glutamate--tRNA ligase [Candidatus Zixiibacteriota bacterium]
MSMPVRVRIAPSPSGHLHVGTARTAVYNWLFARHHNGVFVLRIEDTDQARSEQQYVDSIQASLKWLQLNWDEGPFFQSQRGDIYAAYVDKLRHSASVYPCYCTPDELAAKREQQLADKAPLRYDGHCRDLTPEQRASYEAEGRGAALRLRVPDGNTTYHDLVYGDMSRSNEELDDFICVRADGTPTYNFACVIDDHDMRISHVIRGNDHQINTFKQILIYRALGLEPPQFAHLPLILGLDGSKISKRHGATSITEFETMGFLPHAMVNFLALLGWSPGDDREVMTLPELTESFSLDRVNSSNPVFDQKKLVWLNGEHIRRMDPNALLNALRPHLVNASLSTPLEIETRWAWMLEVVKAMQERLHLLTDIATQGAYFFTDHFGYDEKGVKKQFRKSGTVDVLQDLARTFESIPEAEFSKERTEIALRELADANGEKPARYIHPLRLALTGMTGGPGIFDIVTILGRDKCLDRIQRAVRYIESLPPAETEG